MSFLETVPAEPGRRPTGRQAERILAAELLDAFRNLAQTQTEFAERLQGRLVNHVLEVGTQKFNAAGDPISLAWHAAAGCIQVDNFSVAGVVTVVAAGPSSSAPDVGTGVYKVPAGRSRTVAVASRQVTLWGTPGDVVSYQAFTRAPDPTAGV